MEIKYSRLLNCYVRPSRVSSLLKMINWRLRTTEVFFFGKNGGMGKVLLWVRIISFSGRNNISCQWEKTFPPSPDNLGSNANVVRWESIKVELNTARLTPTPERINFGNRSPLTIIQIRYISLKKNLWLKKCVRRVIFRTVEVRVALLCLQ